MRIPSKQFYFGQDQEVETAIIRGIKMDRSPAVKECYKCQTKTRQREHRLQRARCIICWLAEIKSGFTKVDPF